MITSGIFLLFSDPYSFVKKTIKIKNKELYFVRGCVTIVSLGWPGFFKCSIDLREKRVIYCLSMLIGRGPRKIE